MVMPRSATAINSGSTASTSGARQQAGPQAGRSFRQRRRPCERAGRRRDDRVPHKGRPGPQPDVGSSVAVDCRHPDPHAAHPPDAEIRDAARSLGPVRECSRRPMRTRISSLLVRICPWGDVGPYDRGRCMEAATRRVPGHGPRDDRDVLEPRHRSRYVSGHLVGDGASHAWTEVFDPARSSSVAIDPTHRRRTDLRYITTATGARLPRCRRPAVPTPAAGGGDAAGEQGRSPRRRRLIDLSAASAVHSIEMALPIDGPLREGDRSRPPMIDATRSMASAIVTVSTSA